MTLEERDNLARSTKEVKIYKGEERLVTRGDEGDDMEDEEMSRTDQRRNISFRDKLLKRDGD